MLKDAKPFSPATEKPALKCPITWTVPFSKLGSSRSVSTVQPNTAS